MTSPNNFSQTETGLIVEAYKVLPALLALCFAMCVTLVPGLDNTLVDVQQAQQSFMIHEEYFVGVGAVTGFVLVTLTCLYIWKRCRGESASQDDSSVHIYETVDFHDSTNNKQIRSVSESQAARRTIQESQKRNAVTDENNFYVNMEFI